MIQYPTNVKPCNYAFDATKQTGGSVIEYTFNGDILTDEFYQIIDYDTSESVYEVAYSGEKYSGYKVSHSIPANTLENGRNYVLQMLLCQRTLDKTDYIYDMPVSGGNIEGIDSSDSCRIYIESDITSIYPISGTDGVYTSTGYGFDSMMIKINGEYRAITKYTSEVAVGENTFGCIEIASPFSFSITPGMSYEIFSNFILTPQYYFMCRSTPTVDFTWHFYDNRCSCKGVYEQAENRPIKYFTLKLYWSNNSSFWERENTAEKVQLIAETEKIYAQNIEFDFYDPYYHDESYQGGTSDYYKVVCELVTQDNMAVTIESDVVEKTPNETYVGQHTGTLYSYELSWDKETGRVIHGLRGYGANLIPGEYILYREDLNTGEKVTLSPHFFGMKNSVLYGYDLTASTHGNYRYTIMKFDDEGRVIIVDKAPSYIGDGVFPSNTITTSEDAYYITELNIQENMDLIYYPNQKTNKKIVFEAGDTWKFIADIADTTVTNNLDRMTHIGYGQYVSSTSTNVNYMSGTLSAMIGYIDCTTKKYVDDITLVNAWRKFITQNKPFLLKSQKGDVWVVNIIENPTTQYQESYIGTPTTISFSWAESYNINDIKIKNSGMSLDDIITASEKTT